MAIEIVTLPIENRVSQAPCAGCKVHFMLELLQNADDCDFAEDVLPSLKVTFEPLSKTDCAPYLRSY